MQKPNFVADCAFLGVQPQTGEELLDPDSFIEQFEGPDNFVEAVRTRYHQLKTELSIQPAPIRKIL